MIKLKTFIIGVGLGWTLWAYNIPNFIALSNAERVNVARMEVSQTSGGGKSSSIYVTMDWKYVYAGKRNSCNRYSLFEGNSISSAERDRFESIVAAFQRGEPISGYVSTSHPNRCWLIADYSVTATSFLFFPLLGVCLCYCLQLILDKRL